MERQIIQCIGKIDELLERHDTELPWFESVEEMLEWIDKIRKEYRNYETDRENEFMSIIKAVNIVERALSLQTRKTT